MPFLVATDLDGTLLRRDFTVSQRTRRALAAAADAGVEVVYATGRPPRWLAAVYEATGQRPITVCANGALTLHGEEALHVEAIPEEVAAEVRDVLRQQRTDFVFRSETWRGHTLKLLAVLPDVDQQHADTVLQQVRAAAGHLVEPTRSTHSQLLIEMGPAGVTKAYAVQRLREQRWPGHTLIAIGDMPNDESLLRAADIPLTVTTGHPRLRQVTDRVLPGPDADGVAQLLEELVASL
jgi:HAD superfamily hydrolase (TIGR01484 family)